MTPSDLFQIRDRLHFAEWLTQHGLVSRGVEVGVLFGEYSAFMLGNWPGHLTLVDPWVNQDFKTYLDGCNGIDLPSAEATARAAVAPFGERATLLRMFSEQAAPLHEDGSLAFCYLDGNHAYEAVRHDLSLWWPKVQKNGIMAGHDFYNRDDAWQRCGVKDAIMAFGRETGLNIHLTPCTSWFILKP